VSRLREQRQLERRREVQRLEPKRLLREQQQHVERLEPQRVQRQRRAPQRESPTEPEF
jgi:hypothetical protein